MFEMLVTGVFLSITGIGAGFLVYVTPRITSGPGRLVAEFILGMCVFAWLQQGAEHMSWITHNVMDKIACCDRDGHPSGSASLLSLVLIAITAGLYTLRARFRAAYATVELMLVGTWLAVAAAAGAAVLPANAESRNEWLIKAAAGIYVGVRGVDNLVGSPAFQGFVRDIRSTTQGKTPPVGGGIRLHEPPPDENERH